ncbi:MAG: biotin synthase BioB [Thermoguttaceae bacterium]|nr:biotin synthase BioB [Thermoguttaceae bacterium]
MTTLANSANSHAHASASTWHCLAERILNGHSMTRDEGLAVLRSDDCELLDLLAAAYRVRRRYFGNRVVLNFLVNAKSGICPEDCGYCSQSRISQADIPKYKLLDADEILDGARVAAERRARTYCIVISGRGPRDNEMREITRLVPRIKTAYGLRICVCLGLLTSDDARRLKDCGVDRVNHNLNTSRRLYPKVCTTHTFEDRLATLRAVRAAGLEICSGGIVGMGEEDEDVVDLALELSPFRVDSLPVNFLLPIAGTPMEGYGHLNPRYCLKVLALFRLANPTSELRIAAGREVHLGRLQPLGLYPANSIFIGDYLTTKGQSPEEDYRMIEALGFEPVVDGSSGAD